METSLRFALARNLKERRHLLRISQAELAERADISPGYVGEIEIARKFPTPEILENLANSLEVPAYRLLMTQDDLESEAVSAARRQAYEVALRIRAHLDEELRELSGPFGDEDRVKGGGQGEEPAPK
ncbi:MAG: helix-turn-helix transcriptional regulator [Treponema sp.]|nr:helix-turn-helix transcriptional regulator [Treponema sp.]